MHDFDFILNLVRQKELVSFVLSLGEDNGLSGTVADQDVSQSRDSVMVRTVDDQVLDSL